MQSNEQKLREALQIAHKALEAISDDMTVGDRWTNAGQHLLDALDPVRQTLALPTADHIPDAPAEYFVFAGLDWHRATASYFNSCSGEKLALYTADQLRAQLALAVAKEREECAKVCERIDLEYEGEDVQATWCAAAIRARGENI